MKFSIRRAITARKICDYINIYLFIFHIIKQIYSFECIYIYIYILCNFLFTWVYHHVRAAAQYKQFGA